MNFRRTLFSDERFYAVGINSIRKPGGFCPDSESECDKPNASGIYGREPGQFFAALLPGAGGTVSHHSRKFLGKSGSRAAQIIRQMVFRSRPENSLHSAMLTLRFITPDFTRLRKAWN
jgi:hypothetical protein